MQDNHSLWSDVSPPAARRLLLAALDSFAADGYHGTTTRDIAAKADMSPAAVYLHFASKQELLEVLNRVGYVAAQRVFDEAIQCGSDPVSRVRRAASELTLWNLENQTLARVINYELEALQDTSWEEIRRLRSHFERKLRAEIEAGVAAAQFDVEDVPGTAWAILSLCVDVIRWYSPRSRRSPAEIADLYGSLAVRMLGA